MANGGIDASYSAIESINLATEGTLINVYNTPYGNRTKQVLVHPKLFRKLKKAKQKLDKKASDIKGLDSKLELL